jgi:hypothetical protein
MEPFISINYVISRYGHSLLKFKESTVFKGKHKQWNGKCEHCEQKVLLSLNNVFISIYFVGNSADRIGSIWSDGLVNVIDSALKCNENYCKRFQVMF